MGRKGREEKKAEEGKKEGRKEGRERGRVGGNKENTTQCFLLFLPILTPQLYKEMLPST